MKDHLPRRRVALSSMICIWLLSQSSLAWANDVLERFVAAPSTWDATVSLDGKHIALGCMRRDVPAVCVYDLDSTSKPPLVLHAPAEHMLRAFMWLDHGWMLLRVQKPVYSKTLHRWVGQFDDVTTNIYTQKLLPLGEVEAVVAIPGDPPSLVFGTGPYIVRVDLTSGEIQRERLKNTFRRPLLHSWHDQRGERLLTIHSDQEQEKFFVMRAGSSEEVQLDAVMTKDYPYDVRFVGITNGGNSLPTLGYFGGDYLQFESFDTATGKPLPRDPALAGLRFDSGVTDVASKELVGLRYSDDLPRQKFLDPKLNRVHAAVAKALPDSNVEVLSWSRDRAVATLRATPRNQPPAYYFFDSRKGALSPLGAADLADLPPSRTTAIQYTARDGLKIEAFLTVPANKQSEQAPLPLIVMPHEGPYQRDYANYHWRAEYFAQRGYAVLRPNYRGSTGYGRAFFEKGHGQFGDAIVDDIIDGARYVTASGLADRDRVCATGIGYGGYASLMAGLREPSLIKCIVAVNTISDAVTVLGNVQRAHTAKSLVFEFWEKYLGGRYHDDAAAAAISPARSAARMRPPVLLLHDTRTNNSPVTQSRHLQERMDLYGRDATLIEFDVGDPDLMTAKSKRVILTESDAFFAKHLKKK